MATDEDEGDEMSNTPDHVPDFDDKREVLDLGYDWVADSAYTITLWVLKDYLMNQYGQRSMRKQMESIALGWAKHARERANGRYADSGDESTYLFDMKRISDIRDAITNYGRVINDE